MSIETRPQAENIPELIPIEPPRRRAGIRLQHLLYAVLYCAVFCWLAVTSGLLLMTAFLGLTTAAVFAGVLLYSGRRSAQQDALIWALSVAAGRGMPLATAFEAIAGQCRGFYRLKVRDAASLMRSGDSLSKVIDRLPGLFPRDVETLIRVGSDSGVLPATLREAAATRAGGRGPWRATAFRIIYLLFVIITLESVVGFISYFILPKFEAIFADFGIPLPSITILVGEATLFLSRYWPVLALIEIAQTMALGIAILVFLGLVPWNSGLIDRALLRRHSALILRCLARLVEGDRPLDRGLATLATVYPSRLIRDRLRRVARDVEGGADWCDALGDRGLIRPSEAVLLEAARRAGNLPWALREAADSNERRLNYRLHLWALWLLPLVVLAIGAVVFVVVVAYFTPLVLLIQRLA